MLDERKTIEAVIWRAQNGAKWRSIPAAFGPWHRAANLHRSWSKLGIWGRPFDYLRDMGV